MGNNVLPSCNVLVKSIVMGYAALNQTIERNLIRQDYSDKLIFIGWGMRLCIHLVLVLSR